MRKRLAFVLVKAPEVDDRANEEVEDTQKVVKEAKVATKRVEVSTDDDTDDVMNLIRSLSEKAD